MLARISSKVFVLVFVVVLVSGCGPQPAAPGPTITLFPASTTTAQAFLESQLVQEVDRLLVAGDLDGAIMLCTDAITRDPAFAMGYFLGGILHMESSELEKALEDFDKAIEMGIMQNLDKEVMPGLTAKAIHYFRGSIQMELGAYQRGIEDLQYFLETTQSTDYPQYREDAQYRLDSWLKEDEPVASGEQFDFPLFSIQGPQGDVWELSRVGEHKIEFGRRDILSDGDDVYSERTTIAIASADLLDKDYSKEEFLQFACTLGSQPGGRNKTLQEQCEWVNDGTNNCVGLMGLYEDFGGQDFPFTIPLMLDGYSRACRHPSYWDVMIFLHFSQRAPEGELEPDIDQQAEEFFNGLVFNQPEE